SVSSWDDLRLQVTPGSGVVARSPAALLVVPAVAEHQQTVLGQLIALTRSTQPGSGRSAARKLAGILASSEPDDVPDLAMFAGLGGDAVAVLVLGEVDVAADTTDGAVVLSGRESLTWVDRILNGPSRIVVGASGATEPVAVPVADLVEGVVPGGGVLLEVRGDGAAPAPSRAASGAVAAPRIDSGKPAAAAAAPPGPSGPASTGSGVPTDAMPVVDSLDDHAGHDHDQAGYVDAGYDDAGTQNDLAVPPPRHEEFEVESLGGVEPEQRAPLPVEPDGESAPADSMSTDLVEGVYCKRGHFTDPDSQFCIVCGIGLYETKIKRKGVRPELGFLVFDDGSVFHLDHDYVLGRQPEVDDEVKAGTVRGLRLDDSGGTVSRAHAIVRLVGWNVTIADRKSQNGTLVASKGSEQFVPVSREQPVTLVPGSRIQLGQRTLVYESQRGRS
ncbi:MAG: hypothetical protein QOJ32_2253, partial [Frankiaceae bacterium]|nr:hypothetical protein [Frankiaceae bacterium]